MINHLPITFHFRILRYLSSESGPGITLIAITPESIAEILAGILIG